jgi:hypothetical protein
MKLPAAMTKPQWAAFDEALEKTGPSWDIQGQLALLFVAGIAYGRAELEPQVVRLQAAIDELVAARNEWAHSEDDAEDERVNIAFSVARGLATHKKPT